MEYGSRRGKRELSPTTSIVNSTSCVKLICRIQSAAKIWRKNILNYDIYYSHYSENENNVNNNKVITLLLLLLLLKIILQPNSLPSTQENCVSQNFLSLSVRYFLAMFLLTI